MLDLTCPIKPGMKILIYRPDRSIVPAIVEWMIYDNHATIPGKGPLLCSVIINGRYRASIAADEIFSHHTELYYDDGSLKNECQHYSF